MNPLRLILLLFGLLAGSLQAQDADIQPDSELLDTLFARASPGFRQMLSQPEKYRYQIVYTVIDRNKKGVPAATTHYYHFNKGAYLYPASLAKFPLSVVVLQKLSGLKKTGVLPHSPVVIDSGWWCQTRTGPDPAQPQGMPSMDAYIRKMMLVSDNESYNRAYEFAGYDYLREQLQSHMMPDTRIIQRFETPCDSLSHYITNPVTFFNGKDTLYHQPLASGQCRLRNPFGEVWMGSSYYDASGYLYPFPRSFIFNNFVPLDELQRLLLAVYVPEALPREYRWNIDPEYLNLLKTYMGMWPRESKYPAYALPDNFKKYLLMGTGKPLPDSSDIRIFNVVGRAFGVIADAAYVVDFKNDIEFCVSAIMYCNESDILNSNTYEYETAGLPFLDELGRLLYQYERSRPRAYRHHQIELERLFSGK